MLMGHFLQIALILLGVYLYNNQSIFDSRYFHQEVSVECNWSTIELMYIGVYWTLNLEKVT
jgi:hypothetical protein